MSLNTQQMVKFVLLPSQRLLKYQQSINELKILNNLKAQNLAHTNTRLALISGKSVKCYNIEQGFNQSSAAVLESYFTKKVEAVTIDTQGKIIVTDKFGDIYQARAQNSVYLNSNLGIPTFVKHLHNPLNNKEFIILGDDYCKIKVYNYANMHEVSAIWYIANCVPLDILQINDELAVILVKQEDKQNLKHTYKLYQFQLSNLEEGDFKGNLIYQDKTETLNNSEYHPCSIVYCSESKELYFLKLDEGGIEVISLSLGEEPAGLLKVSRKYEQKLSDWVEQGNWIEGLSMKENGDKYLLISYGKYHNLDEGQHKQNQQVIEWSQFKKNNLTGSLCYSLNDHQHLLKLKLD